MAELKDFIYRFKDIVIKAIIMFIAFSALYLYLPIANRILGFLISGSGKKNTIENSLYLILVGIFKDTLSILIGLLESLIILVIPSGLIIFLGCKMVKKVNEYRKIKNSPITNFEPVLLNEQEIQKDPNVNSDTDPLDLSELFGRGKDLYNSGNYEDAIIVYTSAIHLSNHKKAFFNRGVGYYKFGNKEQAFDDFKTAAKLGHVKSQEILSSHGITW